MNDRQLEHFRTILERWKAALIAAADRTKLHLREDPASFPDSSDRATQESDLGIELRARDRERKLLRKINEALERIAQGTYGYCEKTGEEIGLGRASRRDR